MADDVKYIGIEEFRAKGFLQEANRMFFHPLGLALEARPGVTRDELLAKMRKHGVSDEQIEGIAALVTELGLADWHLGGVWDYRDDPEGVVYGPDMIERDLALSVRDERQRHRATREAMFNGSILQPVQVGD